MGDNVRKKSQTRRRCLTWLARTHRITARHCLPINMMTVPLLYHDSEFLIPYRQSSVGDARDKGNTGCVGAVLPPPTSWATRKRPASLQSAWQLRTRRRLPIRYWQCRPSDPTQGSPTGCYACSNLPRETTQPFCHRWWCSATYVPIIQPINQSEDNECRSENV